MALSVLWMESPLTRNSGRSFMSEKPVYVTTPIYYVNDAPHLGSAYTTIAADVLARFGRLQNRETFFLTGTDEHGEKLANRAKELGEETQAMVDRFAKVFHDSWKEIGISFDDFIRTTEERHREIVLHLMNKAIAHGDVYLGDYVDWYCVSDETFWTEGQLQGGKCPSCGREVKKLVEKNYFFKISKYTEKLLKHIEANPDFILPASKRNEVVAMLKEGVRDISASRTSFTWGIPFPQGPEAGQDRHVIYVWFDALVNYVSALDPLGKPERFKRLWPQATHLIGKDILKFHAIFWPCFLMSVDLPLPKRIFAHGWWTVEGQKMSKSLGNTVDPVQMSRTYGKDALRLFMFREFPMGSDGDFSMANFKARVNADLANNLGNLVSRTLNLISKNLDGRWKAPTHSAPGTEDVWESARQASSSITGPANAEETSMERFEYFNILQSTFSFVTSLNKYFDTKAPWTLAKDPSKKQELTEVLSSVAEGIRVAACMLWPFLPDTCDEISRRLGVKTPLSLRELGYGNLLRPGGAGAEERVITMGQPLFPRIQ